MTNQDQPESNSNQTPTPSEPTVSFTAEEWNALCIIMRRLTWNQPVLMTEWKFIQNNVAQRLSKESTNAVERSV